MPPEYRVQLDAYSGPLDLLLHLVKRHEIDLHDIPIARLTDQFLQHLEVVRAIDVDHVGQFLVMASTLLEIKSQMLTPRPVESGDAEEETDWADPRRELVEQLLAYKRFKDAASALEQRQADWARRFARRPAPHDTAQGGPGGSASAPSGTAPMDGDDAGDTPADAWNEHAEAELDVDVELDDASVMDLCAAFARILDSVGSAPNQHAVTYDETPIALHAEDVLDRLRREPGLALPDLFVGRTGRSEMIGVFLAVLELIRQHRVQLRPPETPEAQKTREAPEGPETYEAGASEMVHREGDAPAPGDAIRLFPRDPDDVNPPESTDAPTDWRDPETGEVQYDWPSDEDQRRAERRAERRQRAAAAGEVTDDDEGDDDESGEDQADDADAPDRAAPPSPE